MRRVSNVNSHSFTFDPVAPRRRGQPDVKDQRRAPLRCSACRVVLSRKQPVDCLVTERPAARIARSGAVTRFRETVVVPYCPRCWPTARTRATPVLPS